MANKNFKVIVVGGGPVGLTLANSLSKAGIDYVVLERRKGIAEDEGASLVLAPSGMRALAQFGILDALLKISVDMVDIRTTTGDGSVLLKKFLTHDDFIKAHGVGLRIFHRAHLVKALYDGLNEDKSRVLTNKKVSDIVTDDSGVTVTCADGTKYEGSIVIGADGVNSRTRERMRSLALKADPKIDIDAEKPFVCNYKTLWCSFPLQGDENGGPPGTAWTAHAKDHSIQYLVGSERSWIFIYELLPNAPVEMGIRYNEQDAIEFANKWRDMAVGDTLTVKDVFPQRYTGGMAALEEGVLKRWSWGRIVLTGDAAHKFTPNQGLGYNNGLQDAILLTNEIYRAIHAPSGQYSDEKKKDNPSLEALSAAFERYQNARMDDVNGDWTLSIIETRMSAWYNSLYWFFDYWVSPYFPRSVNLAMSRYVISGHARRGHVIDFLDDKEPFPTATDPWKHPIPGRGGPGAVKMVERRSRSPFLGIFSVLFLSMTASVAISLRHRLA